MNILTTNETLQSVGIPFSGVLLVLALQAAVFTPVYAQQVTAQLANTQRSGDSQTASSAQAATERAADATDIDQTNVQSVEQAIVPISAVGIGRPIPLSEFMEPLLLPSLFSEALDDEDAMLSAAVAAEQAQSLPDLQSLSEDEAFMQRQLDITSYEELLENMELQGGAWDQTLSEELMSLGDLLQQQGDFNRALDVYTRAAHINRINHGLISVQQVEPIERIVDTHIAMNQWQEADRQQRYAFYVQSRAYDRADPRLIPALDKLANWNLATSRQGLEGEPIIRILEAYRLYNAAAALVTIHFGRSDPRYVSYLKNMTQAAYRLAAIGSQNEIDRALVRNVSDTINVSSVTGTPASRLNGFVEGEQALRNIYELYSSERMSSLEDIPQRRAHAMAELGDWYLLFNRRQTAFRSYREAYDILAEEGPEQPALLFDQLVSLPGFIDTNQAQLYEGFQQGYVDVIMDINQYGRTSSIDVLAVYPEVESRASSDVVRRARMMTFRPRLDESGPVMTRGVRMRFPYWY